VAAPRRRVRVRVLFVRAAEELRRATFGHLDADALAAELRAVKVLEAAQAILLRVELDDALGAARVGVRHVAGPAEGVLEVAPVRARRQVRDLDAEAAGALGSK